MSAVAKKVLGMLAHGDEAVIHVGPDQTPVDFMRAGPDLWIGDCTTPGCRGLIETDSPLYAAALCLSCENKLDLEMEAQECPRPARAPKLHLVAQTGSSLTVSSGKVPAIKLEIVQPPVIIQTWPACKSCGKNLAPDNSSGHFASRCPDCRESTATKPPHLCRECGTSLNGSHSSREYCSDCARGRLLSGQRRQTKSSRTMKERRMAGSVEKSCEGCQTPLGVVHHAVKWCEACARDRQNEQRRAGMARKREAMKVSSNQGDQA